jgi:hypothetical protein
LAPGNVSQEELKHHIFADNINTHASFLYPHIMKAKYGGINST